MDVDGLPAHHVRPVAPQLPGNKGRGHVHFVHQRPPGGVDEQDPVFHLGDGLGVDKAHVLGGGRAMEADHVRRGQQLLQRHLLAGKGGMLVPGIPQHPHAEGQPHGRHPRPDGPAAHHAQGLPLQGHGRPLPPAELRAGGPGPLADAGGALIRPAGHLQQESKHALRHAPGGVAGHVAHGDAQGPGGLHVHHVVPRGENADHLQGSGPLQGVDGQLHLVGQHHVRPPKPLGHQRRVRPIVEGQGAQRPPGAQVQLLHLQGLCVQDHDLHRFSPFFVTFSPIVAPRGGGVK